MAASDFLPMMSIPFFLVVFVLLHCKRCKDKERMIREARIRRETRENRRESEQNAEVKKRPAVEKALLATTKTIGGDYIAPAVGSFDLDLERGAATGGCIACSPIDGSGGTCAPAGMEAESEMAATDARETGTVAEAEAIAGSGTEGADTDIEAPTDKTSDEEVETLDIEAQKEQTPDIEAQTDHDCPSAGAALHNPASVQGGDDGDKGFTPPTESCDICLANYERGEEVCSSLNPRCVHVFHKECIVEWLVKSDKCPVCRRNFLSAKED